MKPGALVGIAVGLVALRAILDAWLKSATAQRTGFVSEYKDYYQELWFLAAAFAFLAMWAAWHSRMK